MSIKYSNAIIIAFLCLVSLIGCSEKDEAKKLGFANEVEMKEIQAKGWHSKQKYDEDRAKADGHSSVAEMNAAEAAENEREMQAIKALRQEAARYPFYAVISCGFSGRHINSMACFNGRPGTEIELKNGAQYGLYKVHQIPSLGKETKDGLIIDLESEFQLAAQNSSRDLILGVKVLKREGDEIVFEKQVSRFGVVSVAN